MSGIIPLSNYQLNSYSQPTHQRQVVVPKSAETKSQDYQKVDGPFVQMREGGRQQRACLWYQAVGEVQFPSMGASHQNVDLWL